MSKNENIGKSDSNPNSRTQSPTENLNISDISTQRLTRSRTAGSNIEHLSLSRLDEFRRGSRQQSQNKNRNLEESEIDPFKRRDKIGRDDNKNEPTPQASTSSQLDTPTENLQKSGTTRRLPFNKEEKSNLALQLPTAEPNPEDHPELFPLPITPIETIKNINTAQKPPVKAEYLNQTRDIIQNESSSQDNSLSSDNNTENLNIAQHNMTKIQV